MSSDLAKIIPKLANHRILVIGDVILDEYVIGRANRLSREAPIPVLEFERREYIPGGAANPSINIAALGSTAIQVGVVGSDVDGKVLHDILEKQGIDPAGLVTDHKRPTTTKTRIMAHMGLRFPQQVARIDRIDRSSINDEVEQAVIECLNSLSQNVDAVMVSDYLTGLLTPAIVGKVRELGLKQKLLTTADAQGELDKYQGFDLVKCNADEASQYVEQLLLNDDDFAQAGYDLMQRLRLRGAMLITRGSEGVTLVLQDGHVTHVPAAHIENVYDTVGAGDTALAVVTLALVAGATYVQAARLVNFAAGIVVRKVGNYAPTQQELLSEIQMQG